MKYNKEEIKEEKRINRIRLLRTLELTLRQNPKLLEDKTTKKIFYKLLKLAGIKIKSNKQL